HVSELLDHIRDFGSVLNGTRHNLNGECNSRSLCRLQIKLIALDFGGGHKGGALDPRVNLLQHRTPFSSNAWFKGHETRHIAAGPSQTADEAGADRVSEADKDNWDNAALLLQGGGNRDRVSQDHVGLRCDELFRERLHVGPGWRIAIVDADIAALRPPASCQTLTKGC